MKRIISLLLIAVLCAVLLVSPAAASTDGPSKAEIKEKWQTVTNADTIFETVPSTVSPYAPGALTADFLESGITYLNFVRYVAGLPEVTLDDTLNTDSQYGAVCLAAIDTLTHYPTQPDDMDDAFFDRAYDATTSANISARWGYARLESLQSAISGCMADNGSYTNLSTVGHRRWLLNPTLGKVGFGYAESPSGWSYIVNHVHDRTGAGCDYDFISWPVSGNHPTNLFDVKNPWSITLNTSKYKVPSADELKITITRESDGRQWSFDSTTGQPSTHESPYMIVNSQWYGIPNCIIFHPGSGNVDAYTGIFTVDATGIYTTSGKATSLHYQVDFFDLYACLHEYEAVVTAPTCTEEGYTTFTCTLCGDSYTENRIDALGHSFGPWQQTQAPGCETTGTEQRSCTVCAHTETRSVAATGHSYTAVVTTPTCTDRGYTTHTCTVCGDSYIDSYTDALGHSFGPWQQTQAPGCESSGTEQRSCTVCAHTETRSVAATGHSYTAVVTTPTCTEQGYTTHTCTVCGHSYTDTPTAPLGHACGEWTVTTAPTCTLPGTETRSCVRCDYTEQRAVSALGHDYVSVVTEPDCDDQGFTTHTCSRCSDSYVDSYVAPLGHPFDAGVVIQEPTETEPGVRRHTCMVCGVTEDRVIPALGHTHSYDSVVTEPTCTQPGFTTHTCACGDSYTDSHTPALGHEEVVDEGHSATCTEPGLTDGAHCGRCDLQLRAQEVIPATGHHYEAVVTEPTCTDQGFTTRTCSGCGDSHTDTFVPALGHDWHGLDCLRCGAKRENPFRDVAPGSFYEIPVMWAVDNGITNGVSATEFGPGLACNRAQVVTFLWRACGAPEPQVMEHPFVDVQAGSFYEKAVVWAVEKGITNGLDATHFGPTAACNRAQVVTFLWRTMDKPASNAANPFTDVKAGDFYYDAVLWAVEHGITNGLSATEFGVNSICNRAQIVTFLYRTLN